MGTTCSWPMPMGRNPASWLPLPAARSGRAGRRTEASCASPFLIHEPTAFRCGKSNRTVATFTPCFQVGTAPPQGELWRPGSNGREWVPFHAELAAYTAAYSRDGQRIAYLKSDGTLWTSDVDGGSRLQLTFPPMKILMDAQWSPDGKRIAFMGRLPGKPWKIYLISAQGGTPQRLLPGDLNEADPRWSPDGNLLVFGRTPDYMGDPSTLKALYVVDLKTNSVSTLPGSEGLFSPRWSPDGRYIVAMPLDQRKLVLFDFKSQKWVELAPWAAHNPVWSWDSTYVYFQTGDELYRVRCSDRTLERIAGLSDVRIADTTGWAFSSLDLDNSPLMYLFRNSSDIYALEWEAH